MGDLKQSIEEIKQKIDKGISTAAPKESGAAAQDSAASGIVSRIQDKIVQLAKGGDSPAVQKHLEAIDARLDDIEDRLSKVEGEGTTPAAEGDEEVTTAGGDEDVTTTGGDEDVATTGGEEEEETTGGEEEEETTAGEEEDETTTGEEEEETTKKPRFRNLRRGSSGKYQKRLRF